MKVQPIRALAPDDFNRIAPVLDAWWGGRPVRALLPRLFFEHFNTTSFVIGPTGMVQAFLIGFRSQSRPALAYIHFVGVDPACRAGGLGRRLYEHFFQVAAALGCSEVECITSPANTGSIAFHQKMGFALLPGSGEVDGVPVMIDYAGEGQHRVRFHMTLSS